MGEEAGAVEEKGMEREVKKKQRRGANSENQLDLATTGKCTRLRMIPTYPVITTPFGEILS